MLRHFVSFICVSLCAFVLGAPTTRPPLCQTHGGSPCKFPFIYKGQRYTTCKTEDSPENAWCATVTGSDLTMTSWHYCTNPTCSRHLLLHPPMEPISVQSTPRWPDDVRQLNMEYRAGSRSSITESHIMNARPSTMVTLCGVQPATIPHTLWYTSV